MNMLVVTVHRFTCAVLSILCRSGASYSGIYASTAVARTVVSGDRPRGRFRSRKEARLVGLIVSACALSPGLCLAAVSAMWGTAPPQANGNFSYFQTAEAACQYQHDNYSPLTPFLGVKPNRWGVWSVRDCLWPSSIGWSNPDIVTLHCVDASGNGSINDKLVPPGICVPNADPDVSRPVCTYNQGANSNPTEGDPILIATGSLYERVIDYEDTDRRLTISRVYRSRGTARLGASNTYAFPYGLGDLWRLNFQWEMALDTSNFSYNGSFALSAPDGSNYSFRLNTDGTVTSVNNGVADISMQYVNPGGGSVSYSNILSSGGQFQITTSSGDQILMALFVPYYSTQRLAGRPLQITYRGGYAWSFTYGPLGELQSISDNLGRSIGFTWYYSTVDTSPTNYPRAIQTITLPDGTTLNYSYETYVGDQTGSSRFARLKTFSRTQNGAQADSATYLYSAAVSPVLLTGMLDNAGIQFNTWQYDASGRVVSAAHPNGADAVSVAYSLSSNNAYAYRTVTNSLGRQTVYTFLLFNEPLLTSVVGNPTSSCIGTTVSITYDANNRQASVPTRWAIKRLLAMGLTAGSRPSRRRMARHFNARRSTLGILRGVSRRKSYSQASLRISLTIRRAD